MEVIILLIVFSVIVATAFLMAFIWAVRSGQYDDTTSPSVRMLFEDSTGKEDKKTSSPKKK